MQSEATASLLRAVADRLGDCEVEGAWPQANQRNVLAGDGGQDYMHSGAE